MAFPYLGRRVQSWQSSSLLRNVLAVATGSAAGQAVVFAFSPLITRIYGPEAFGLQGVFLSLISILGPAIALRYPMAIVMAQDDASARRVAKLAVMIAFAMSCLLGVALALGKDQLLQLLGAEALGNLVWFLPPALFCVALQDVADFQAARIHAFRLVGAATVIQAFLTNMARVLGGLITPVAGILVAVTAIAPSVQAAMLTFGSRKYYPRSALEVTAIDAVSLLKKYRDFPFYRMPTDVLNAASQSVPVIMLAALFSPAAAGLYTLTRSVLNLPSNIIGTAVGNVLYSRFAELAHNRQPLTPLLLRATMGLLAPAPLIIGLAWFAPAIFAFVFGEEWREAGYYGQWMSVWITLMIANVPAVRVVPVIGEQHISLISNILLLLVRVLAVWGAYWSSQSAVVAVAWFSVSSAIMIGFSILYFIWRTAQFDRQFEESSNG